MEKIIGNAVGKTFVSIKTGDVQINKILFYDEEKEKYVYRPVDSYFNYYGSITAKELEDVFFSYEEYIAFLKSFYEENKFFIDFDLEHKPALFKKNVHAICEGLNNIDSVSFLKNEMYKREIRNYQKGIRRNKKIIYRFIKDKEYEEFEKNIDKNFFSKLYKCKNMYKKLISNSENIKKAFINNASF